MESPLHILHLEDNPNDAALIRSTLEAGGIASAVTQVQTRDEFVAALEGGGIDLILSDFGLPTFDGLSAVRIAHARRPDIPLILVSGTPGEEQAIDSLNDGAIDFVPKERLFRLVPAVRRAMREAHERAERRRFEAQFVEAQKMEVIGHLASGIAHDFNNILGVIIGYNDWMMPELAPDSLAHKCAEEIGHAAERAVALTQQLLLFSRKRKIQQTVLNLHEVIESMDKMLRRLIGENVKLAVIQAKETGQIKADSGLIGQLLMNLVVNARDAMPNGGNLKIETANVTSDESQARAHAGATSGDHVMLAITDTGIGMSAEVKTHLFEAFFTTKPEGKGTGLGLATCQTIVRQCGGWIEVQSEQGKGSTFKIYFPRAGQPAEPVDMFKENGNEKLLARGTETLLLVEDEPSVRHLTGNILEAQGYNVLRANNGQDGLRVASEYKQGPIDLVITDIVMPQMNGKVMAEWLKATYPDLKILFISGYTDDAIAQHGVLEAGDAFLPKPYSPATLAGKVRSMLDDKTAADPLRKLRTTTHQTQ